MSLDITPPSTPGKQKTEKSSNYYLLHHHHYRSNSAGGASSASRRVFSRLTPCLSISVILFVFLVLFLVSPPSQTPLRRHLSSAADTDPNLFKKVIKSSQGKSASSKTVLVTGAAGFVGSHLSIALKRRGDGVVGLDNFNPYYEISLKRSRQKFLEKAGVFVVDGDLNDAALLAGFFEHVAFTHVFHLAAQAGVRFAARNPSSYVQSNVAGLVTLLEACKSAKPQPAVVWASSSSVYGLNPRVPFSEKDRTDQPASLYAASKKAGEMIAHTYNHIYGLSITGLRFFTVYGPWGRPDMAYFFFTRDILKGREITVYETADGRSVARDFTYIDDVVHGCVAALDTAKKSTGMGGKKRGPAQFRVYNLGNTTPVRVGDMVRILEKLLKVTARKKVVELPHNGDVERTHANISLAQRELGFRPITDLETGLKKFVRWYKNYYIKKKISSW